MEEYIESIKQNLENSGNLVYEESSGTFLNRNNQKLREVIVAICNCIPEIKIINNCDEDGNITFEASMKSAADSFDFFEKYRTHIYSSFVANFIGELIVRENIDQFAKIIIGLKKNYNGVVNKYVHKTFGMTVFKNRFVFKFHISLVESIMAEDVKRAVDA